MYIIDIVAMCFLHYLKNKNSIIFVGLISKINLLSTLYQLLFWQEIPRYFKNS